MVPNIISDVLVVTGDILGVLKVVLVMFLVDVMSVRRFSGFFL